MNQNKQKAIEVLKELDDYIDALSFEEIEQLIDALNHMFIQEVGNYGEAKKHWRNLMSIYRKLYVGWDFDLKEFPALIEAEKIEEVDAINLIYNKVIRSRDKRMQQVEYIECNYDEATHYEFTHGTHVNIYPKEVGSQYLGIPFDKLRILKRKEHETHF